MQHDPTLTRQLDAAQSILATPAAKEARRLESALAATNTALVTAMARHELGCEVACTSTLPGTASRRNMERHGFSVAYPKLVLLKPT